VKFAVLDDELDKSQEMELLKKAAVIAMGVCDLNQIPKEFYQFFLILWEELLKESSQKAAPVPPINEQHYGQILDRLTRCFERSQPLKFVLTQDCPASV